MMVMVCLTKAEEKVVTSKWKVGVTKSIVNVLRPLSTCDDYWRIEREASINGKRSTPRLSPFRGRQWMLPFKMPWTRSGYQTIRSSFVSLIRTELMTSLEMGR